MAVAPTPYEVWGGIIDDGLIFFCSFSLCQHFGVGYLRRNWHHFLNHSLAAWLNLVLANNAALTVLLFYGKAWLRRRREDLSLDVGFSFVVPTVARFSLSSLFEPPLPVPHYYVERVRRIVFSSVAHTGSLPHLLMVALLDLAFHFVKILEVLSIFHYRI